MKALRMRSGFCALSAALVLSPLLLRAAVVPSPAGAQPRAVYFGCAGGFDTPQVVVTDLQFQSPKVIIGPYVDRPVKARDASLELSCGVGAMSPDGTRLAVTRNGFLYLADVAAPHSPRGTVLLAVRDAQGDPVPGWGASWSPDGTKLALAGQASGLSVVRPDGNGRYEVVSGRDGGGPARDAEWAPAGDRIAFSMGPPEATHLYIVEAARSDGRNVRPSQVTTDPQYTERWPHWSPDGTEVLFTRGSNGSPPVGADAISFILSLRTGVARQIGGGRNRGEVGVGWSRLDGRVYLVEHQAGAQPQLVSLKPDGTDRREIAARSVPAGRIDWVPADARWGSTFLLPSPVSPLTSGRAAKARPPVGVPSPR